MYEKDKFPENTIIIYTDGASSGNPGPGGIGVFLKFREHEKEISESIGHTTNNIAELTAIQRALLELKRYDLPVRLYTDSSYALGILTKGWKASKNQELVADIRRLTGKFMDLRIIKTKGHSGIEGNERADKLATQAIKKK
ncbi:MAG: ribonuclease HI [Desulfamplus sp.]|nr:ribonuclease HI [Desulfamplus sp.]